MFHLDCRLEILFSPSAVNSLCDSTPLSFDQYSPFPSIWVVSSFVTRKLSSYDQLNIFWGLLLCQYGVVIITNVVVVVTGLVLLSLLKTAGSHLFSPCQTALHVSHLIIIVNPSSELKHIFSRTSCWTIPTNSFRVYLWMSQGWGEEVAKARLGSLLWSRWRPTPSLSCVDL